MNEIEQRTEEWFAARLGKVTAIPRGRCDGQDKNGLQRQPRQLHGPTGGQRITGEKAESFTNAAMQWGTRPGTVRQAAYEAATGVLVDELGFVPHPTIEGAGASPDGLVGDDGLVEIKCPNTATPIDTLLTGSIPSKYVAQMQFQMACTGRAWCDFVCI